MPLEDDAFRIEKITMPDGAVVVPPRAEAYDERAWKHPFRSEAFLDAATSVVGAEATLKLAAAVVPAIPDVASVSDRLAIRNIQRKRDVQAGTTEAYDARLWVMRTLYEESFAVVLAETDRFLPTVGGVVSHYHRSEADAERFAEGIRAFGGDPLAPVSDILTAMHAAVTADHQRSDAAWNLLREWNAEGVPRNRRSPNALDPYRDLPYSQYFRHWMKFPMYFATAPRYADNFHEAALYLRVREAFKADMSGLCTDTALLGQFGLNAPTDRGSVVAAAWGTLGSERGVFDSNGWWRDPGSPEGSEAVKKLVAIRTHPDFRFLYRDYTAGFAVNRAFPGIKPLMPL